MDARQYFDSLNMLYFILKLFKNYLFPILYSKMGNINSILPKKLSSKITNFRTIHETPVNKDVTSIDLPLPKSPDNTETEQVSDTIQENLVINEVPETIGKSLWEKVQEKPEISESKQENVIESSQNISQAVEDALNLKEEELVEETTPTSDEKKND
jgi:hypothetical protein